MDPVDPDRENEMMDLLGVAVTTLVLLLSVASTSIAIAFAVYL